MKLPEIFGWLADQDACGHYRVKMPLVELARLGHTVSYNRRLAVPFRQACDGILIGQRICLDGPTKRWVDHARNNPGRPELVYEIDDNLLDINPDNETAFPFFSQPNIRDNIRAALRAADRVIVSTEPLADAMRHYNSEVRVVPNSIEKELLEIDGRLDDPASVTIGWQGSATHLGDWEQVVHPLRRLLRTPTVRMTTWGTPYATMSLPEHRHKITHHQWVTGFPEYYHALKADIMLAPLRPGVFNQSKSHIRVLEAAALGIPVVASHFGPYAEFVRHGMTGFLVKRDHEWLQYLRVLTEDLELRQEMGAHAKAQAADHTIQTNIGQWVDAITG